VRKKAGFSIGAHRIVQRRRTILEQNELGAIRLVELFMLPSGEAEDERGLPRISKKYDILFAKPFLPPPPPLVRQKLQQAKPDVCLGYVTSQISLSSTHPSKAAFTINEELLIASFQPSSYVHFPFLTAQWKSSAGSSTLHAQNQAARDGAVAVNSLSRFFLAAEQTPSIVRTCHFSLVCDVQYGEIWIHWKQGDVHHMEIVFCFAFRDEGGVERALEILS
ncbi:hypothetical protein V8E54_006473, partial [Elaphomyces granulatus]